MRSLDALGPDDWAAPLVLLAGLLYDPPSLRAAADLLGAPDAALLRGAGQHGMADPRIASVARDLAEIGLAGAAALGDAFLDDTALGAARYRLEVLLRRGAETPGSAGSAPAPDAVLV